MRNGKCNDGEYMTLGCYSMYHLHPHHFFNHEMNNATFQAKFRSRSDMNWNVIISAASIRSDPQV